MAQERQRDDIPDAHFFEYRNIRHVKTTTELEQTNDDFDKTVIEKYEQIAAGTYQKSDRAPGTHDLRHDPAKLHKDVEAVLAQKSEVAAPELAKAKEPAAVVTMAVKGPSLGEGELNAVPRNNSHAWYDVIDSKGEKVNKTPVRKKEALAFVEEANRGKPTTE